MKRIKKTFFFVLGICLVGGGFLVGFLFQHFLFAQVFPTEIESSISIPSSDGTPLNLQPSGGSCGA